MYICMCASERFHFVRFEIFEIKIKLFYATDLLYNWFVLIGIFKENSKQILYLVLWINLYKNCGHEYNSINYNNQTKILF